MPFDPNKITFFARTDARGKDVPFGIKAKDRQRHMYVIGKTGMGKSTMLENMAVQDIQNGEGMAFIDPHGGSAETILNYIPPERVNDVVYFAPFDMDYPISFNIMEDVGPDKRHLVVSGLMSVFKKIWVDAWSARMEYILSNTLLALLEYPESTLLGVNRMLSDKDYRKMVVDNVKDPGVKAFWVDEFAKYNERYMQEAGDAIKNKIGQFTSNPIIRNIVGQSRSSFDIRKMMDEKKILIINLSKGLIGETNANLLGSMLTTRIYLAAMSRADLSPQQMEHMPNFYFYVDEFQSFANATFANILSEARKYRLNLTIAHQYIEQMEEEVRDAVFGNVGTTIAFRVGPLDAEFLEAVFTPQFLATDLVNLGFAQIYLTLMIDGIGSQPFSATTLPPVTPPATSCKDMVIAASRKQFAHPRAEVEEIIHKFHEPVVLPKPARKEEGRETAQRESKKEEPQGKQQAERKEERRERRETPKEDRVKPPEEDREVPEKREGATQKPTSAPVREERRDQSSSQRTEQSKRPPEAPHKTESPRKVREENLEDLRAVLRRVALTQDEKGGSSEPVKGGDPKKFEASRGELKSALSSVLNTVPQNTSAEPTPAPVAEATPQHKVATSPQTPPEPRVTPKELERMMRVTTSDKPPF